MALEKIDHVEKTLNISKDHAHKLVREGVIAPPVVVRVGGSVRINAAELEKWIAGGGAGYDDETRQRSAA